MENPDKAHARRGAPWTFDAAAFVKAISDIREKGTPLSGTAVTMARSSGGQSHHHYYR